jgi:hypothetical protein
MCWLALTSSDIQWIMVEISDGTPLQTGGDCRKTLSYLVGPWEPMSFDVHQCPPAASGHRQRTFQLRQEVVGRKSRDIIL